MASLPTVAGTGRSAHDMLLHDFLHHNGIEKLQIHARVSYLNR